MPVNEVPLRVCNKIDWLYDQTCSHQGEHTVRVNIKCVNASWAARSSAFVVHAFPAGVGEFVRVDEGVVARLTNVAVPEAVLLFLPQLDLTSTPVCERGLLLLTIAGRLAMMRWRIIIIRSSGVGRLEFPSAGRSLLLLAVVPTCH